MCNNFEDWHKANAKYMEPKDIVPWCQQAWNDARSHIDLEAISWAYEKCVALGLENSSMESAMMMDRLKLMLVMDNARS